MTSRPKQFIVELSQSNIRLEGTYGSYNQYSGTNSSPVANSIYFMSKPRLEYYAFFRFMPSVRTYYKILEAIEKLKIKGLVLKDMETMSAIGETVFTKQNNGFNDIMTLLRKNQYIPNKASISEFRYWESC